MSCRMQGTGRRKKENCARNTGGGGGVVTWVLNMSGRVWKRWRGGKGLAGKDKANDDDKNNDIRDGGKWGGVDEGLRVRAGVKTW